MALKPARGAQQVTVTLGDEPWILLAQRAAFSEQRRWLVIADAHFGKAAAFRARGVPVPQGTTTDNLTRLDQLIEILAPQAIVFLGDLFHAREAHAPATLKAFQAWRERHSALELVLVEGNHDQSAGPPPAGLRIHCEDEPWRVGTTTFCHHPQWVRGAVVMAGHLHPAIRLQGRADDSLRLACFWLREGLTVLPAFGSFTGGACIARGPGGRVVALADDRLFEIPELRSAA